MRNMIERFRYIYPGVRCAGLGRWQAVIVAAACAIREAWY